LELVNAYAGACGPNVVLKTDLFEEACGKGALFDDLFPGATLRIGVDLAFRIVANAVEYTGPSANLLATDVRRLPFRSSSVDLILSNSTLDHFESATEFKAALIEVARVLRRNGSLIITLDNPRNPLYWPLRWMNHFHKAPFPLGYTCSGLELMKVLEECGLRVEQTGTLIHNPRCLSTLIFLGLRRTLGARADRAIHALVSLFMFSHLCRPGSSPHAL
jgi:SAM-dependent methyltransferase